MARSTMWRSAPQRSHTLRDRLRTLTRRGVGRSQLHATALIMVAFAAVVLAAPAMASKHRSASAPAVRDYLNHVRPIAATYAQHLAAAFSALNRGLPTEAGRMRTANKLEGHADALRAAAVKLEAVRRPPELAEPHAGLSRSVRLVAKGLTGYADVVRFAATASQLNAGGKTFLRRLGEANELQTHWRQELTVLLRRGGVPVPLWVKAFKTE